MEGDPTGDERWMCDPDFLPVGVHGDIKLERGTWAGRLESRKSCFRLGTFCDFLQWVGGISNILKFTWLNILVKLQFKVLTQSSKYFILRNISVILFNK